MTTLFKIEAKKDIRKTLKESLTGNNTVILLFDYAIAVISAKSSSKKPYRFSIYAVNGDKLAKGYAVDFGNCVKCIERAYDEIHSIIDEIKSQNAAETNIANNDKITLVLTKEEASEVIDAIDAYLDEEFFSVLVPNYITTETSSNGSDIKKTTFRDGWRIGSSNGGKISDADASEMYYSAIRTRTVLNRVLDRLPALKELGTDKLGMDDE